VESQFDVCEREDAANHQTCADEQDDGERDLADYKYGSHSAVAESCSGFAKSGETRAQVASECMNSGRQTADHSTKNSDAEGKEQDNAIEHNRSLATDDNSLLRDYGGCELHAEVSKYAA